MKLAKEQYQTKKKGALIRQLYSSKSATCTKKGSGRVHTFGWNALDKEARANPLWRY